MESTSDVFFKLRNGIDVVPLDGGDLLFRSDSLAIRIEGTFARILHERVLPLLDGSTPFEGGTRPPMLFLSRSCLSTFLQRWPGTRPRMLLLGLYLLCS